MKTANQKRLAFLGAVIVAAFACVPLIPLQKQARLRQALQHGDGETVLTLLQNGLNPNTDVCINYDPPDFAGRFPFSRLPDEALPQTCSATSPLIVLAAHLPAPKSLEVVADLLRRGVSARARDDYGVSPLEAAIEAGDEKTVALLLQKGADPLAATSHGTALHFAAARKKAAIVRLLLRGGVAVDVRDRRKGTALMDAAHQGSLEIVGLLLQHGANPNAADNRGLTPLHTAFNANWNDTNAPVIHLLLRSGASLFHKNNRNQMPLDSLWILKQFKRPQSLEEQLHDELGYLGLLTPP